MLVTVLVCVVKLAALHEPLVRDLDGAEAFAGEQAITLSCWDEQLAFMPLDKVYDGTSQNILTSDGYKRFSNLS